MGRSRRMERVVVREGRRWRQGKVGRQGRGREGREVMEEKMATEKHTLRHELFWRHCRA